MCSPAAELMSCGKRCNGPECGQRNFLPFRCRCGEFYCDEHRRTCSCLAAEAQVQLCRTCALSIMVRPGEDVEEVLSSHKRTECDPANYDKVHRKPRCPVDGCNKKLNTVNSYTCKDCNTHVCLDHRFPTDHKCPGPPPPVSATPAVLSGLLDLGLSMCRHVKQWVLEGGSGAAGTATAAEQKDKKRAAPGGATHASKRACLGPYTCRRG